MDFLSRWTHSALADTHLSAKQPFPMQPIYVVADASKQSCPCGLSSFLKKHMVSNH